MVGGTPHHEPGAAIGGQDTAGLLQGAHFVGKKLQTLLAEHNVKCAVRAGQGACITLAPVHGRAAHGRNILCYIQHGLVEIHADHFAVRAKLLRGEPGDDARTASNIKDPLSRRQANPLQQHMGQGLERTGNLVLLISLGPGAR